MKISLIIFIILFNVNASAYKEDTHSMFSEYALSRADIVKKNKYKFSQYGIWPYEYTPIFPIPQSLINSKKSCAYEINGGKYCSVDELISLGAYFEDSTEPDTRSLHHFYDPVNDRPLTVLGFEFGYKSPDWALEDNQELEATLIPLRPKQEFSYRDAMKCLYLALTSEEYEDRDNYFSCTFKNLGQVIHHVQDMAQPDHVRNDQHLDNLDSSLYEQYTFVISDQIIDPVFKGYLESTTYEVPIFDSVREYWTTRDDDLNISDRKGLADFTNYNFVSKDTIFHILNGAATPNSYYDNPIPDPVLIPIDISHPDLMGDIGQALCDDMKINNPDIDLPSNSCVMEFVSTTVSDKYTNQTYENNRAATRSLFDKNLVDLGQNAIIDYGDGEVEVDRLFTLNKINFNSAHKYLVPRAIAYSAGVINSFFKGNIDAINAGDISDVNANYIDKDGWKIINFSYLEDNAGNKHYFEMEGEFQMYYWAYINDIWKLKKLPGAAWHTNSLTTLGWLDDTEWFMDVAAPSTLPSDLGSNVFRLVFKGRIGNDGDPNAAADPNNTDFVVAAYDNVTMLFSATTVSDVEFDYDKSSVIKHDNSTLYIASNNQLNVFNSNGIAVSDEIYRIINHVASGKYDNGNDYIVVEYNNSVDLPMDSYFTFRNTYYQLPNNTYYPAPSEALISTLPYGYQVYEWEFGTISKYPNIYASVHDESFFNIRYGKGVNGGFSGDVSVISPPTHYGAASCRRYYLSDINPSWPYSTTLSYSSLFTFDQDNPKKVINDFILVDILQRSSPYSDSAGCKDYY